MKKNILFVLRFLISFFLIYFLLRKIDFHDVFSQASNLNYYFLFLAYICQFFAVIGATYRWKTLLSGKGIEVGFRKLLTFGFIGLFFSSFLPGSVGGDFVRIYKIVNHSEDKISAGASVFAERIIGMYVLFTVTSISAILSFKLVPRQLVYAIFFTVVISFLFLIIFLLSKSRIINFLEKSQMPKLNKTIQYLSRFYETTHFFITHRNILIRTILISLIMEFFSIISCYFVAKAIGLSLFILYFFLFLPIIFFSAAIPISLSGIGIREGVFVYLFGIINVPASQAVLISLLYFTVGLLFSLIGGVIYLVSKFTTSEK